jgi:hypothetical protein
MFEQVFDNLRKATELTIQTQQELLNKWLGLWSAGPAAAAAQGEPVKFQTRWVEIVGELINKQRASLDAQFSAGLRHIEEAFHLAEARDPGELRTKTVELWQKAFECLRQTYEAQTRDFQNAVGKWTELVARGKAE